MRWKVALVAVLAAVAVVVAVASALPVVGAPQDVAAGDTGAAPERADVRHERAADVVHDFGVVRAEVPAAGLFGVLLDDLGAPLPRETIYLRLLGNVVDGATVCTTDGDGRFAFAEAHGDVRVSVEDDLVAATELTLAGGEHRFLELQVQDPCLVLEGTVRYGPDGAKDRMVLLRDADVPQRETATEVTDDDGNFRFVLKPGRYEIEVRATGAAKRDGSGETQPFPAGILTMSRGVRRVRRDIALPVAEIRVTVRQAFDNMPATGVKLSATPSPGGPVRFQVTDRDGIAVFRELRVATWHVASASIKHCAEPEPDIVVFGSGAECHAITMLVTLGGAVELFMSGSAAEAERAWGTFDPFGPRCMEHFVMHLAGGSTRVGRMLGGRSLQFWPLPPGRHQLRCEDRVDSDGCLYAPFEPFVRDVEVRADTMTGFGVDAAPRSLLTVLLRDREGRPWPLAFRVTGAAGPVKFTSGLQLVVVDPSARACGGTAFVPAGSYRVVVDAPSGPIEEEVEVAGREVVHVMSVPGQAPPMQDLPQRGNLRDGR